MFGTTTLRVIAALLALLLVLGGVLYLVSPAGGAPAQPVACAVLAADVPGADESGLPVQPLCALPPEAARTWQLIVADGPFPYDRDGVTFQNREGLLPRQDRGFYREFTVPTPGEGDRGARRFVTGGQRGPGQQLFYTADHYESFVVVDATAVP